MISRIYLDCRIKMSYICSPQTMALASAKGKLLGVIGDEVRMQPTYTFYFIPCRFVCLNSKYVIQEQTE